MSEQRITYLKHNLRAKDWHDFLNHIGYYRNLALPFIICVKIPPTYIRSDNDRWEYLRQITVGHVLIPRCGPVCRRKLAQFLQKNDPENTQ